MQTFLPYPDFSRSAEALDTKRLGKQRVEALQILRALHLPAYGWGSHPAVTMWSGHAAALVIYTAAAVAEWRRRGFADTVLAQVIEFAPEAEGRDQRWLRTAGLEPPWLGGDALHRSHRSALLRKDPSHYRPLFGAERDDLDYHWPPPPPATPPVAGRGGTAWVVRAPDRAALGAFVDLGVMGLDGASGIREDVSGLDGTALRARLRQTVPRRRPGKALEALELLASAVGVGDRVLCPIEGGDALLVGEVTGPYECPRRAVDGLVHLLPVRWGGRAPRSAVEPRYALQDPRALFRVTLAAALADVAPPAHARRTADRTRSRVTTPL